MRSLSTKWVATGAIILSLAGCAGGPRFSPLAERPQEKALVYIYRPGKVLGSGVAYTVKTGSEEIVTLKAGGYYPYLATPGEREFWARTEAKASVTEQLRAGETYYLRGGIGVGFFVGHPKLAFVSREEGEREIADCRLLSK